jgi:hypothetical protein
MVLLSGSQRGASSFSGWREICTGSPPLRSTTHRSLRPRFCSRSVVRTGVDDAGAVGADAGVGDAVEGEEVADREGVRLSGGDHLVFIKGLAGLAVTAAAAGDALAVRGGLAGDLALGGLVALVAAGEGEEGQEAQGEEHGAHRSAGYRDWAGRRKLRGR